MRKWTAYNWAWQEWLTGRVPDQASAGLEVVWSDWDSIPDDTDEYRTVQMFVKTYGKEQNAGIGTHVDIRVTDEEGKEIYHKARRWSRMAQSSQRVVQTMVQAYKSTYRLKRQTLKVRIQVKVYICFCEAEKKRVWHIYTLFPFPLLGSA